MVEDRRRVSSKADYLTERERNLEEREREREESLAALPRYSLVLAA